MTVAILVVVIAILLFTCHPKRDYTVSAALLIAAFTWLAIETHLLRLLRDVLALALDHWLDTVMAFGAVILLVVPASMLYIAVRDHLDRHRLAHAQHESFGPSRITVNKFERRVATLMALGYSRTQAEATALHQMKRDLDHSLNTKRASNHHA
ncbi:MAG: hypothetical protein WBV36_09390 [Terriglobales bacterium]